MTRNAHKYTRRQATEIMLSMLNADDREDLDARIAARQEDLDAEIEAYGSTEGKPLDLWEAFVDACEDADQRADYTVADGLSRDEVKFWKEANLRYSRILIKLGYMTPISEEDARERVRNGLGMKMKHFPRIDGQRYESDFTYHGLAEIK